MSSDTAEACTSLLAEAMEYRALSTAGGSIEVRHHEGNGYVFSNGEAVGCYQYSGSGRELAPADISQGLRATLVRWMAGEDEQ